MYNDTRPNVPANLTAPFSSFVTTATNADTERTAFCTVKALTGSTRGCRERPDRVELLYV